MSELKKINIGQKLLNITKIKPEPNWENILIVSLGMITNCLIFILLGKQSYIPLVILMTFFIEMFMVSKIPLKTMAKSTFFFMLMTAISFFTASICYGSYLLSILFFLSWFILFLALQLGGTELSNLGLLNVFIFFFVRINIISYDPINYFIVGILLVVGSSIPMFIIRLIQRDPGTRTLLARLFCEDVTFQEFTKNREILIRNNNSQRLKSLINIAMHFFIANTTVKSLSSSLSENYYKDFENEIDRLLKKVEIAILNGYDYDFELNLGNITEFQKDLEFKLDSLDNKTPRQELFNTSIKKYKSMFEDLNLVLADKKVIEEMEIQTPHINNFFENLKNNFSYKNKKLRHSFRFLIATFIGFVCDVVAGTTSIYPTTLVAGFTLSPNLINTKKLVYMRIVGTLIGAISAIVIAFIFSLFNLEDYTIILCDICFLLFFVFENDKQISLLFFISGFIFLMPSSESIDVAIEHIISTILGIIIIIIVNNNIIPNSQCLNPTKLLIEKMKITQNFITNTLILNEDTHKYSKKISKNNYELNNLIEEIEGNYENVEKDIRIFNEINDTLGEIRTIIVGMDTYIDANSINYDFKEFEIIVNDFINYMIYSIKEENYTLDISYNFNKLEEFIASLSSDLTILKPSFEKIQTDFEYINDLVIKGEEEKIFDKFNQEII